MCSPARSRLDLPLDGGWSDRGESVVGGFRGRRGRLLRWNGRLRWHNLLGRSLLNARRWRIALAWISLGRYRR